MYKTYTIYCACYLYMFACDIIVAGNHDVKPAGLSATRRLTGDCGKYYTLIVSNVVRSNNAVGETIDTTVGLGSCLTCK